MRYASLGFGFLTLKYISTFYIFKHLYKWVLRYQAAPTILDKIFGTK